jgi:hypothetical protein
VVARASWKESVMLGLRRQWTATRELVERRERQTTNRPRIDALPLFFGQSVIRTRQRGGSRSAETGRRQ